MVIDVEVWSAINRLTPLQFANTSTERVREEIGKALKVDPVRTITMLYQDFPVLWAVVQERGIWFKATTESK